MIIPRERGLVRFYIQLQERVDPNDTTRVDKSKFTAEKSGRTPTIIPDADSSNDSPG